MKTADRNSVITFVVLVLIGYLVALAGGQGSVLLAGIPLFTLCVGLIFVIQWVAFVPAYLCQTEKFFDLTGSLTYIAVMLIAAAFGNGTDLRTTLLTVLVVIWAIRLGTFLFLRIQKTGKDDRFDAIKPSFIRFLNVWTLQALWVTFTAAAALVAMTSTVRKSFDGFIVVGFLIWVIGFSIEVVADLQKSRFSANPANKGKFIQTGLWAYSRHPNYFGEIMLWVGIAIIAMPVFRGWQWVALLSPIFVALLLTRVSGIPLLEKKADAKWGGNEDYEAYKKNTPVLVPKLKLITKA